MKPIDEIIGMSDENYKIYISDLLKEEDAVYKIDELDDELLKMVERHPGDVERICEINSLVFAKLDQEDMRNLLLAYNFNTLMLAAIFQNNIPQSKSVFIEGITFCLENNQHAAGKSMSQNVFRLFASTQISLDEAPYFLTKITDFYNALGKYQDTIEALCAAAAYFADVSAFQSAYRALHDAQEIAITQKVPQLQIRILETQGVVALIEGDLDCAGVEFQKCFDFYKSIKETPPFQLRANAALVELRKENYGKARDIYQTLLNDYQEAFDTTQHGQIKINLLVCYRELGDTAGIEDLSRQIEMALEQYDLEARIEARLILSKTYFHVNELPQGTAHVREACIEIQRLIDQYQRLHYRRGVREQYITRIKSMLMSIEASGNSEDSLHALLFCTSNSLLDWFSALEWIEIILQGSIVPAPVKEDLLAKRDDLIRYGTPFIYGFREKYDDPFEFANDKISKELGEQAARGLDYSLPWREFNDLTAQICQLYSYPSPFEGASIQNGVDIINRQLLSGVSFLFSFVCKEGCVFVFVAEGKYIKSDIPLDNLWQFLKSLYDYQRGNAERSTFHTELIKLQKCVEPTMAKLIDILVYSSISELVFIPDHLTEIIPILPTILANEQLRSRIEESKFVFRTCPTVKEQSTDYTATGPSLFIFNSEEALQLAESEKSIIKKTFPDQDCFEIDLKDDNVDFAQTPANSAKLLHLATHSIPANAFTDPFFVSTSIDTAKKSIWLESVQREAHNLNFRLVVLNGCNTGATSNTNYFKKFLTNEKVGLTSAFLLNRRCTVIATQWNEPDIIGYIFAALFYKRLAGQPNEAKAFIIALVDMYELTKDSAIGLLNNILDQTVRQKWCDALNQSQSEYIFRNAYILGMFQCHSLLFRQ